MERSVTVPAGSRRSLTRRWKVATNDLIASGSPQRWSVAKERDARPQRRQTPCRLAVLLGIGHERSDAEGALQLAQHSGGAPRRVPASTRTAPGASRSR